jgi:hypothetical protein
MLLLEHWFLVQTVLLHHLIFEYKMQILVLLFPLPINCICEHTYLIVALMISRQCDSGCSQLNGVRDFVIFYYRTCIFILPSKYPFFHCYMSKLYFVHVSRGCKLKCFFCRAVMFVFSNCMVPLPHRWMSGSHSI